MARKLKLIRFVIHVDFMGPQKNWAKSTEPYFFEGISFSENIRGLPEGISKNMIYQEMLLLQHVSER